jgi:hypothetical protein
MPPSKARAATPPVKETPPAAKTETPPAVTRDDSVASAPTDSVAMNTADADEDANGVVGKKRRGIRLKQDLD